MTEVGQVLGVDFQYFVHVNWASLIDVVEILGGITVTLDVRPMIAFIGVLIS